MADTYTTNLSLKKPGYDSPADIMDINDNMDKLDKAAGGATSAAAEATKAAQAANAAAERTETAITNANAATKKANDAADTATTAAGSATSASVTANSAAEQATSAATEATEAAADATEKAGLADTAATKAEASATKADTAAQNADEKADYIGNITVSAHDVEAGGEATAEKSDVAGHLHIEFGLVEGKEGKQGPKGDQGEPNIIKGNAYASLEELQIGVPSPNEGDQYNVGSAAPYNVYRWTGDKWEDQGTVQGPVGPAGTEGPAGKNGATFTPTVSPEGMLSWTNDQELPNPESVDIRGPKGDDGAPGLNGTNGENGKDGAPGEPGAPGKDGVTPHIDEESGNWFIGEEDTHVHAQGPKGEPGTTAGVPYSDEEPKPLGAATAGVSEEVSRADHVHKLPTADDIQAVPVTRTINGHELSDDVTLTADDIQAVPVERTINTHPLSENVTLTAADVGAVSTSVISVQSDDQNSWIQGSPSPTSANKIQYIHYGFSKQKIPFGHVYFNDGTDSYMALYSSSNKPTATDVGAVPISRKVNNKPLTGDVVLAAGDVGAVPTNRKVNGQTLDKDITIDMPDIEYNTVDLEAGTSPLETGKIYLVYE